MKQKIRIQYTDFWGGFDATKHSVTRELLKKYESMVKKACQQLKI